MITLSDSEFILIENYVKENYGINLRNKRTLIEGRLAGIITSRCFESYGKYFEKVISDKSGQEVSLLIDRLTTNHTFFLREEQHFDYLKEKILPYLISKSDSREWRIWSAGCSSGEEPYTIAMVISDFLGNKKSLWDTRILATDISTRVLETGINGIYSFEQVDPLPEHWKRKYFKKISEDKYLLIDEIRDEVIFRKLNLIDSKLCFKKKFHLILCRNVMIYFDNETKKELVRKFYEMTEPGGYLFIGHTENIDYDKYGYRYVMPAIYRKG